MTHRWLVLALAALSACKGKSDDKPAGSGTASAAPIPSAGSAGSAGPATTPPPSNAVKITAQAGFGCVGWSATAKAAACITGEASWNEDPRYQLDFVGGGEPALKLAAKHAQDGDTFEDAALTAANAALAKHDVQPFAGAKEIEAGGKVELGGGASLAWTAKQIGKGGDNTAPTNQHAIVATCANKQTAEILKLEIEGFEPELVVWTVADHAVIDLSVKVAREGEYRETSTPMVLELATCALTPAD